MLDEGNRLEAAGSIDQAYARYRAARALAPDLPRAHLNVGNAMALLGDEAGAISAYEAALASNPDFAPANFNLGNLYLRLRQPQRAVEQYERALRSRPAFVEAVLALGNACYQLGQWDAATEAYRRAAQIRPDFAEAHSNLGIVLQELGRIAQAEACYRRALAINPESEAAQRNLLFCLNYLERPAAECLAEAHRYGQIVAAMAARPFTAWNCTRPPHRLRVGLVSGDLCRHPVGYFLEAWLSHLAPDAVELYAYVTGLAGDDLTARLKPRFAAWTSVAAMSDEAAARRIHDDGVHILIDLAGHTGHSRLPVFAWKPAPVQVTWLGYFATTGVAQIDYLIADPWTLPAAQEQYFSEQVWRLPSTRLCFSAPDQPVAVSRLPALASGRVTFGCFNNLSKVNDAVIALWGRLLCALPGSRLVLRSKPLAEAAERRQTAARFAAQGVDAERLVLQGPVSRAEYLAGYQDVDIALDPFPYPGGATTAEALWMGVPVLTLAGEHFLSRQGVGLMTNAGLADWVAHGPEDYLARALRHAADLPALAALRSRLREQVLASPLFDGAAFARALQEALQAMWLAKAGQTGTPG